MIDLPTVLIAEDDPVFRSVIGMTVTKSGFAVEMAADGEAAFARLVEGGIDFLITDHQMPRCSGHELLKRIAETPAIPSIPTILCTAKGFELDSRQLRETFGLVAILHKPFSPSKLGEMLRSHLQRSPEANHGAVIGRDDGSRSAPLQPWHTPCPI